MKKSFQHRRLLRKWRLIFFAVVHVAESPLHVPLFAFHAERPVQIQISSSHRCQCVRALSSARRNRPLSLFGRPGMQTRRAGFHNFIIRTGAHHNLRRAALSGGRAEHKTAVRVRTHTHTHENTQPRQKAD